MTYLFNERDDDFFCVLGTILDNLKTKRCRSTTEALMYDSHMKLKPHINGKTKVSYPNAG